MDIDRPRITLHAVASLDGVIAKPDNDVSWLELPGDAYPAGVSEAEAAARVGPIDCFVLGARTYEHALEIGWPYADTPTVVVTTRTLPVVRPSVEFYSGDLQRLVGESLAPRFRHVWLVGGAHLCQQFLRLGLVDEIRLSVAPVLLGEGLRLFGGTGETRWRLKAVDAYTTGIVELAYERAGDAR